MSRRTGSRAILSSRRAHNFRNCNNSSIMYNRNKDGNNSEATNKNGSNDDGQRRNTTLSYEEIIRGIGFAPERGEEQESIPEPQEVRRSITEVPEDVDEEVEQEMDDLVAQQIESIRNEWHVPRLGDMKKTRPQGVFRIMSGNVNNMSMRVNRDGKIARIVGLQEEWDIQAIGLVEVGVDWRKETTPGKLSAWFRSDRDEYKTAYTHNTCDDAIARSQPGGVAMIGCKELRQYIRKATPDFRNLGRWHSWLVGKDPNHCTRIIFAYQVTKNENSKGMKTILQQHRRAIQHLGLKVSPRQLFQDDLIGVMKNWRKMGERIILFIDANEHVLTGKLPRRLFEQLDMEEATNTKWGEEEPRTHIRGSFPIDGVYHTKDLEITSTVQLSFHESVGDHRNVLVDISTRSAIGDLGFKIIQPKARRLNSGNEKRSASYRKYVEEQLEAHRLPQRQAALQEMFHTKGVTEEVAQGIQTVDTQKTEIQIAGEKQCGHLTREHSIPFSPDFTQQIILLRNAYSDLAKWATGKTTNSNIISTALRRGIPNPRQMTFDQCRAGAEACNERIRQGNEEALQYRREFLRDRLARTADINDKEKHAKLLAIIQREKVKDDWRRIKQATGKPITGAIQSIQKVVNGITVDVTDGIEMNTEIQNVTERRFDLARSAPVMTSSLTPMVGFCADTPFAHQLVQGVVDIPQDVDNVTTRMIEEIQVLWDQLREKHQAPEITKFDFKQYWTRQKEATSSSLSGVNFSHMKVSMRSEMISQFLCEQLTLIGQTGIPPNRWSKGLQVMLEKVEGNTMVEKLRAILLMEGDYNFFNKLLVGFKAMNTLYKMDFIPEDQYSQRSSTAEDARLDNRLTMDLSKLSRAPMVAISADADKCYDRINHVILSLVLRAVCGESGVVRAMLQPIQQMQYFQRTGRGDSNTYMGGRPAGDPLHGICQGNGAGPAMWLILSSLMAKIYGEDGHGSFLISPITKEVAKFMGQIFVDDTDLLKFLQGLYDIDELMDSAQCDLDKWTELLIATGGALNPEKCYWYLVKYKCVNGEWEHDHDGSHSMSIILPDGSRKEITQVNHNESKKMLGVWSNPTGSDDKHLKEAILGRAGTWATRVGNSHLSPRLTWKAYRYSLWPALRYGLATLATPLEKINNILHKHEFEVLPMLGFNRHIKTEWRTIAREFGGVGMYKLTAEQCIGWIDALLQHYGTKSILAIKMKAALEAIQLEIGCIGNPLEEYFELRGKLATWGWMIAIWERMNHYALTPLLAYKKIIPPRQGDRELVAIFLERERNIERLKALNRCRLAHQALFLSCVCTVKGTDIEDAYKGKPLDTERRSDYNFAPEQPTSGDWVVWREFWKKYRNRTSAEGLGAWVGHGHRVWEWVYDKSRDTIYQQTYDSVKVFSRATKNNTRSGGYFISVWTTNAVAYGAIPISIKKLDERGRIIAIDQEGEFPRVQPPHTPTFWEYLGQAGGVWMWKNVAGNIRNVEWVATAMEQGTAVVASDGSFNPKQSTQVCSAGWIVYCRKTRNRIKGSMFEISVDAGSFRGELLGLVAVHTLAIAISIYYKVHKGEVQVVCDSTSALKRAKQRPKRVRPGSAQADILRTLRAITNLNNDLCMHYTWVKGHTDRHKAWSHMSTEEQLNTECDRLADEACQKGIIAIHSQAQHELSSLPHEQVAILSNGVKIASNLAKELRYQIAWSEAKAFYTAPREIVQGSNKGGLGWTPEQFASVDWRARERAQRKRPEMFGVWLAKQESGFCRTQRHTSRIQNILDDRCPNCLRSGEDSKHLNRCTDPGRVKLFRECVRKLEKWMNRGRQTDPRLATLIKDYLMHRGFETMESLSRRMPHEFQVAAASQDSIGWVEFLHGKVAVKLIEIQSRFCCRTSTRTTGRDWSTKLVRQLHEMSHSQWLYRNFTLHHKTIGYLRLRKEKEVRRQAEMLLMRTNQADIPEDCHFLLEIEATPRTDTPMENISYWILAMNGALAEMEHERRREQQARRRGNTYKKTQWNIVDGVREAYAARWEYRGRRRMEYTPDRPGRKRRKMDKPSE